MKTLLLLGLSITLCTACLNQQKKNMLTNGFSKNYDQADLKTPMEPAIERAKDTWNKTKFLCEIVMALIP